MDALVPGRSCPLSYRYDPAVLARSPDIAAETLYVAGGVYGNEPALATILDMHAAEPDAVLVFNGDFNWFDVDPDVFERINRAVLARDALRGNVETELASADAAAGCGCVYPQWVGDADVERSNAIIERLRAVALGRHRPIAERLAALPMHRVAAVGGERVAIVHGDLESLAGWGLAQEHAGDRAHGERIAAQMARAGVRIVAGSHTCLPVLYPLSIEGRPGAVINNGSAGMPNFRGERFGVITRISVRACPVAEPLYALRVGILHLEALAVRYDHARFLRSFEQCWAPGSSADLSYRRRIVEGPDYTRAQALRGADTRSGRLTIGGIA